MRKTPRKLALNRITLRSLSGGELEVPAGGATAGNIFSCAGTCAHSCGGTCTPGCSLVCIAPTEACF